MKIHFVYRAHYNKPNTKHYKVLEGKSVLHWWQKHWKESEDPFQFVCDLFGDYIYGLAPLFEAINNKRVSFPNSVVELTEAIESFAEVSGVEASEHHLQAITDNDDLELAYYFFDETYAEHYPERVAYLLETDWALPSSVAVGQGFQPSTAVNYLSETAGQSYFACQAFYTPTNLTDLDTEQMQACFSAAALPDLLGWMGKEQPSSTWPDELRLLWLLHHNRPEASLQDLLEEIMAHSRELGDLLIAGELPRIEEEVDVALALAQVNDWRLRWAKERGERPRSRLQFEEHLIQLSLFVEEADEDFLYHHWIFFDAAWASQHPHLANSILRYAQRWDVL